MRGHRLAFVSPAQQALTKTDAVGDDSPTLHGPRGSSPSLCRHRGTPLHLDGLMRGEMLENPWFRPDRRPAPSTQVEALAERRGFWQGQSARAQGFGREWRAAMARRTLSRLASTMPRSREPGALWRELLQAPPRASGGSGKNRTAGSVRDERGLSACVRADRRRTVR